MRLIDADDMVERYVKNRSIYDTADLLEMLGYMPTIDATPIVRCKDCKYLIRPLNLCGNDGCQAPFHTFRPIPFSIEEHWCRFGEQRGKDDV